MNTQRHERIDVRNSAPSLVQIDKSSAVLGVLAVIFSAVALGGVLIIAILMPEMVRSRAESAAAKAEVSAGIAQTNSLVALDYINNARLELAKKGIEINIDGH